MDANDIHETNRRSWDRRAASWAASADTRGTWRRCHHEPELVFDARELALLSGVAGKDVCVPGSGDNEAVFALAGMGARVTSVDVSEGQLAVARERAAQLGLGVTFVQADVTRLEGLADERFDLVYTGGHVAVWVADLWRYYAEAARILRPGGTLIVSEYHPFRRPWRFGVPGLEQELHYFDRGPHSWEDEAIPGDDPQGERPVHYEFHWTVSDYITALLDAGCELMQVTEFGDGREEWEDAPLERLPRSLLLAGRKRG